MDRYDKLPSNLYRIDSASGMIPSEAFEVELLYTDARNVDCPTKIPANRGGVGDWYEKGCNHRVENGRIKRDLYDRVVNVIDIDSIEKLIDFVGKYGEVVFDIGFITIYDDYLE